MTKQYEINWEALAILDDKERINAMWYLLQAMSITIEENIYKSLTPKGKQYFITK